MYKYHFYDRSLLEVVILPVPIFGNIILTLIRSIIFTRKLYFAEFQRENYDLSIQDHIKRLSHSNTVVITFFRVFVKETYFLTLPSFQSVFKGNKTLS